jgi:hypothetical protein
MHLLKRLLPPLVLVGTAVWLLRSRVRAAAAAAETNTTIDVTPTREVPWGE